MTTGTHHLAILCIKAILCSGSYSPIRLCLPMHVGVDAFVLLAVGRPKVRAPNRAPLASIRTVRLVRPRTVHCQWVVDYQVPRRGDHRTLRLLVLRPVIPRLQRLAKARHPFRVRARATDAAAVPTQMTPDGVVHAAVFFVRWVDRHPCKMSQQTKKHDSQRQRQSARA